MSFSLHDRAAAWTALGQRTLDLVVVGGGINGAGIARDAARRGLSVALVEKGDLASGTSSRSSRLIHGGLRYLESLQFGLVFESTHERAVLGRIAPHLARPLPFLIPIYRGSRHGRLAVTIGLWLYEGLSGFDSHRLHRSLGRARTAALEPSLRTEGLRGSIVYWDRATDDSRLTLENAIDAAAAGALVVPQAEVVAFRDLDGRVAGVRLEDRLGTGAVDVRARLTVAAVGPWLDGLLGRIDPTARPRLRPTKGVHIVFRGERLPISRAIAARTVGDERVVFLLPWGTHTVVGTTDTDHRGSPEGLVADADDVRYLVRVANHYAPRAGLAVDDVVSTWAGLRPLLHQDGVGASQVSREHEILEPVGGLLAIAGGKLTTYRRMAEEVVDRVVAFLGHPVEPCATASAPLPGAPSWAVLAEVESSEEGRLLAERRLPADVAFHLHKTHGRRALEIAAREGAADRILDGLPHVWAEVDHAVEEEMALRLEDVLVRRTNLFHKAPDQGLSVARPIARRMGDRLGWTGDRIDDEVAAFEAEVALNRSYRQVRPASS